MGCPSAANDDDSAVPAPAFTEQTAQEMLDALADGLDDRPAFGCTVGLARGDGATWEGAVGRTGPDGEELDAGASFGVASISKTYTAGLVLELVDDGLLSLDDTLEQHLPGVHARGGEIQLDMLLQHTAGLPGFLSTPEAQAEPERAWTEDELFALVADLPLLHEPGTSYSYSNTHFALLARVAESAAGAPWRQLVSEHLLTPLGLTETRVPDLGAGWGDVVDTWYGGAAFPVITHPQAISAAGNFVSTAGDVARWGQARFGGGLHSDAMMALQLEGPTVGNGVRYGLGLLVLDTEEGDEVGHNGALNGFATWVGHRPERDVTLSLLCNAWGGGNPPDPSYPLPLSQELWDAVGD